MNEMFSVFGRTLCQACGDRAIEERPDGRAPAQSVFRHCDPTVCAKCGRDAGTLTLEPVAGLPACETCRAELLHRPFPTWVKVSFALILALAVLELARDWRLFQAYVEMPRAHRAMEEGRVADAADLMERAARHVPEYPALAAQAKLYRGLQFLREGRFADAEMLLDECRKSFPPEDAATIEPFVLVARVHNLIDLKQASEAVALAREFLRNHPKDDVARDLLDRAEIAEAFDTKDYDAFLARARDVEIREPDNPSAIAQVASALACKYAETGLERYRQDCLAQLDKAKAAAKDTGLQEYEERILHRLKTREIIDKDEYNRRYRAGTKKENTP